MHTAQTTIIGRRSGAAFVLRAAVVAGYGLLVCGCNTDQQIAGVPDVPTDVRMRHPITITEAPRTMQLFIGANRGALNPEQRAEVLAFSRTWKNEATGGVLIDLPTGTGNQYSSADAAHEIQSILAASGVPPQSMMVRTYPAGATTLATVRITYPKIVAQAGPCGMWPEDIGPSFNRDYFENQPAWNMGCASQHNLAAMIENPADLVEPRAETPAYTQRRTQVVDKYRQGQSTATQYPNSNAGRITDFGQ
ncbi:MAG TPA: CpaD family pilus assembly protein [Xanthobacteraceae bacterium]|nr:CpaD family pilus assembly protein [Xanthobacteraceae bacterium]